MHRDIWPRFDPLRRFIDQVSQKACMNPYTVTYFGSWEVKKVNCERCITCVAGSLWDRLFETGPEEDTTGAS
jgi:hypothetical protein